MIITSMELAKMADKFRAFRSFPPGFARNYSDERILDSEGPQLKPMLKIFGEWEGAVGCNSGLDDHGTEGTGREGVKGSSPGAIIENECDPDKSE